MPTKTEAKTDCEGVHESESGRTVVTVEMDDDGKGSIFVDRDGQRVHRFDFMKEPVQKAGLGN